MRRTPPAKGDQERKAYLAVLVAIGAKPRVEPLRERSSARERGTKKSPPETRASQLVTVVFYATVFDRVLPARKGEPRNAKGDVRGTALR
jgi:hypothetical protein